MKRMKALGVVEWHLTSRQAIYYLLSIGMPTAFYLFFSGDVPGHARRHPLTFMRDYLLSMTAFSMMSTAIFSFPTVLETDRLNNWQKYCAIPGIYGRILFNKGCRSLCRFSPIDWSCLYRGTCGAACEYVPTGLVLSAFILILGSLAFVALGLVFDPASFQSIDVCCGQSPLHGGWLLWVDLDAH